MLTAIHVLLVLLAELLGLLILCVIWAVIITLVISATIKVVNDFRNAGDDEEQEL